MKKKPPLPEFDSDEAARRFVDEADLSAFDLSGGTMIRYEFQPKTADVHLRMPQSLLDAVKAEAGRIGIPYQRLIRQALETVLAASPGSSHRGAASK